MAQFTILKQLTNTLHGKVNCDSEIHGVNGHIEHLSQNWNGREIDVCWKRTALGQLSHFFAKILRHVPEKASDRTDSYKKPFCLAPVNTVRFCGSLVRCAVDNIQYNRTLRDSLLS